MTLATFNFAFFFPLLVVAVYRLPGGVAAAAGGLQPLLVALMTRLSTGRRPRRVDVVIGHDPQQPVSRLVVIRPGAGVDPIGVLAAVGTNVSFAVGRRPDEAIPDSTQPARRDRLAVARRRRGHRAAGA